LRIFLLQLCEYFVILWFNLSIEIVYIHIFAFLNFWFERKIGSRIFFWPIGVPKKITNFQKILKKTPCTRRRKSHFFLSHPCYVENRWSINDHNYFFMNWLPASSSNTRLSGRGASSISNFNWCSIYLSINQSISIFSETFF